MKLSDKTDSYLTHIQKKLEECGLKAEIIDGDCDCKQVPNTIRYDTALVGVEHVTGQTSMPKWRLRVRAQFSRNSIGDCKGVGEGWTNRMAGVASKLAACYKQQITAMRDYEGKNNCGNYYGLFIEISFTCAFDCGGAQTSQ